MTGHDAGRPTRNSVVGHFRVWEDVYDSLEAEAKAHKTSLNTLVNQILSTHTTDDVIWEEMGYVKLTKIAFREFLSRIPDGRLIELGPVLANDTPSSMMLARRGAINLDSVLDYLRFRSRAGWFSLNESKRNGMTTICLMHDFGPRESALLRYYLASLFGLIGIHPKVITTDSSVVIEYQSIPLASTVAPAR